MSGSGFGSGVGSVILNKFDISNPTPDPIPDPTPDRTRVNTTPDRPPESPTNFTNFSCHSVSCFSGFISFLFAEFRVYCFSLLCTSSQISMNLKLLTELFTENQTRVMDLESKVKLGKFIKILTTLWQPNHKSYRKRGPRDAASPTWAKNICFIQCLFLFAVSRTLVMQHL